MITFELDVTDYRSCSCCAVHRKPNYETIKCYDVALQTSKNGNAQIIRFCEDCLKEFINHAKALQ